jgi:hypothetical protein
VLEIIDVIIGLKTGKLIKKKMLWTDKTCLNHENHGKRQTVLKRVATKNSDGNFQ